MPHQDGSKNQAYCRVAPLIYIIRSPRHPAMGLSREAAHEIPLLSKNDSLKFELHPHQGTEVREIADGLTVHPDAALASH